MKTINKAHGFVMMYWDVIYDDNLTHGEKFLMSYLLAVYPTLKKSIDVQGKTYKRLSDSFIQEVFDVKSDTIRKWLNDLERFDYIKIYKENNKPNGVRYITINTVISTDECPDRGSVTGLDSCPDSGPEKIGTEQINRSIDEQNYIFASAENKKKSELDEYLESLNESEKVKELIRKWYLNFRGQFSVQQISDKLQSLKQLTNDPKEIYNTINSAYLNNYRDWNYTYQLNNHHDNVQQKVHTTLCDDTCEQLISDDSYIW